MRLGSIRKQRNLTQKQVADLLEIPLRTYQNYEREVNDPDTDTLCRLADCYGITVDYLVGYSPIANPVSSEDALTSDEARLLSAYRSLSQSQQDTVLTMILALTEPKG